MSTSSGWRSSSWHSPRGGPREPPRHPVRRRRVHSRQRGRHGCDGAHPSVPGLLPRLPGATRRARRGSPCCPGAVSRRRGRRVPRPAARDRWHGGGRWFPVVGMNAAGLAFSVLSVTAEDDGVGVPRVLVSRDVLQATNREDVVRRAAPPHRSGGYAYEVAVRDHDGFLVETTATRHAVLDRRPAHANHYLAAELAKIAAPPSAGSVARLERTEQLLASHPPRDEQGAMAILSDHRSQPRAICLHADPAEGDAAEAVVFSMVCDVESMRMWVARGNPCVTPFEQIDVHDVLGEGGPR